VPLIAWPGLIDGTAAEPVCLAGQLGSNLHRRRPGAVLTVRTYGDTGPPYGRELRSAQIQSVQRTNSQVSEPHALHIAERGTNQVHDVIFLM
jgi:hypothetical protein